MPLTQAQLRSRIAGDLLKKYMAALTSAQVRDAINGLPADKKTQLADLIRRGDDRKIGQLIMEAVRVLLLGLATTEAQQIVSDNQLNAAELNRWLGDG